VCSLLLQAKQPFERIEVTRDQALEMFAENPFKVILSVFVT
jgi:threonyl-tRNA synthetase